MSVAFELEYEIIRPKLRLVPDRPVRIRRPARANRWRLVVVLAVAVLLVLLMLPIRSLGGSPLAAAAPAPGQEYIVKSGDTVASIAQRADSANPASMSAKLAAEVGSDVVVPGEHIRIP